MANAESKFLEIAEKVKAWLLSHPSLSLFLTGFFLGLVTGIIVF